MSLLLNGLLCFLLQAPAATAETPSTDAATSTPAAATPAETTSAQPAAATATQASVAAPSGESPAGEKASTAAASDTSGDAVTSSDTVKVIEQATEGKPVEEGEKAGSSSSGAKGFLTLLAVMAILFLPFILGQLLANSLEAKEWGLRIGVCLFAFVAGIAPFVFGLASGRPITEIVRLGIDLKGGTNIVFQVLGEGKELTPSVMEGMVGAVAKRINPSGTEEITVRQVGKDRIEVIIPGADPESVDETKRRITRLGSLEFFIAASRSEDREIVQLAESVGREVKDIVDADGNVVAIWRQAYEKDGVPKPLNISDAVSRSIELTRTVDGSLEKYMSEEYLLVVDPPDERVTGKYLQPSGTSVGFGPMVRSS